MATSSKGSGGTTDYSRLNNKPSINGVTLSGNMSASDLRLATAAQGTKADNAIPMPTGTDGQILEKDSNETSGVKWVNKPSDGQDGASAYELYEQAEIAAGRTPLSQEAWLASLKANIGEFLFVPTDAAAVTAMATIGQTYSSAIDPLGKNVAPSQNTLSVILLMNDDATTPTKTMMIATQDDGSSGFEFVYAGDLQSAMPSNVLTETDIDNSFAGGSGKVAGAIEVKNLAAATTDVINGKNLLYGDWEGGYYNGEGIVRGKGDGLYYNMVIACNPNTDYYYSVNDGNIGSNVVYYVLIANDDSITVGDSLRTNGIAIHTNSNTKAIGVSIAVGKMASEPQLELGDSRTTYEAPYQPTIVMKSQDVFFHSGEKVQDSDVTDDFVGENEQNKIADARQINKLLETETHTSKNLLYLAEWESKFYSSEGSLEYGSLYHHKDVPCDEDTVYCLSVESGVIGSKYVYVVLLDENKGVLSDGGIVGKTDVLSLLINTGTAKYIGVSAAISADDLQLEVGTKRTSYEEPYEPYQSTKIKESMLPPVVIPDGSITQSKLSQDIVVEAKPNTFNRIFAKDNYLASNTQLFTDFIECFKNITVVGRIMSSFTEVQMGLGYHDYYGGSFRITGQDIIYVKSSSDIIDTTVQHGLSLGTETIIIIDKGVDLATKVTLINDNGEMYQHTFNISPYYSIQGRPFLSNNGNSAISAEITLIPKDINQKIWMFGDSYFSYNSSARWPYYLINDGYVSNLMISKGGDSATKALDSLTTLLATGSRPSYILWFMGMNAGNDNGTSPNATWLEKTQSMLSMCEEYYITPILSTVPTVPNGSHVYMNQWIRESGYRYIDMAIAVEDPNDINTDHPNHWKNWGETNQMLAGGDDLTHPTSYGAKALYSQVLSDFPEITVLL